MSIDTLPKAIADLWQFLFTPIITLLLLFLIAYWTLGDSYRSSISSAIKERSLALSKEESKKTLESYGLDKLMPIIAAFLIISALHVSLIIVRFVGDIAPPRLEYTPSALYISVIADEQTLTRLISNGPPMSADEARFTLITLNTGMNKPANTFFTSRLSSLWLSSL